LKIAFAANNKDIRRFIHLKECDMLCPLCKVELKMTDRKGIEVDYCPQCRGIWLDRGELDKLIERSERQVTEDFGREESWPRREDRHRSSSDHEDSASYRGGERYDQKPRKRESWFSDLFDWD
jgi:hypothetical protein